MSILSRAALRRSDNLGYPNDIDFIGAMPLRAERETLSDNLHECGCVCGAVRFRTKANPDHVVVSHCEWCQRRTGSAFAVIPKFRSDDYELLSGELTVYHGVNNYGRWLDLRFCPHCGPTLVSPRSADPGRRQSTLGLSTTRAGSKPRITSSYMDLRATIATGRSCHWGLKPMKGHSPKPFRAVRPPTELQCVAPAACPLDKGGAEFLEVSAGRAAAWLACCRRVDKHPHT